MFSRATTGGAVFSAFGAALSWICCLPFVLGGLGAFSAALASVLGPLRPYLVGASFLLLGGAFYRTYRPSGEVRSKRQRALLWLSAGLILLFLTVPYWLNWVIYWSL